MSYKIILRRFFVFPVFLSFPLYVSSQVDFDSPIITQEVHFWVHDAYNTNREKYFGNKDVYFNRGIKADRTQKEVVVLGVATGLSPHEPVEFLLVAEGGKEYESVAVTPADALDIVSALKFIGVAPGRSIDPSKFYFWPKGERVIVTVQISGSDQEADEIINPSIRVEKLIVDHRTQKVLPAIGFTFVGPPFSQIIGNSQNIPITLDTYPEIITVFNSSLTLFDIPNRTDQSEVYGSLRQILHINLSAGKS